MQNQSSGIGFFGLLALLFIGLKLGGAISWSWWWVTAPIWGPAVLLLAFALVCCVVLYVINLVEWWLP